MRLNLKRLTRASYVPYDLIVHDIFFKVVGVLNLIAADLRISIRLVTANALRVAIGSPARGISRARSRATFVTHTDQ
jgi:hypothetical protein